ncbi:MAG: agmatinase [Tepidisphaeraceae bacterium]
MQHLPAESNFLKIDEDEFCSFAASRFVVYGAPYEHTSSYRAGSKNGPDAIIRASQFVELYDEELDQESYKLAGVCTVSPLDFSDKVDESAVSLIESRTRQLLKDGKFPIMLGAEHTVTLGAVRAARATFPDLCVLQIDAHSDLRESYEGSRYSHASVMARVHELGVPLVQVGIRAQCREEAQLIRDNPKNIHTLYAHELKSRPTATWVQEALRHVKPKVYVTIDADGFDPSIVPAVGTAEPNGLTWGEGLALLRAVFESRQVVGMDVVEIAPLPHSTISEFTLAKLIYKLVGVLATRR